MNRRVRSNDGLGRAKERYGHAQYCDGKKQQVEFGYCWYSVCYPLTADRSGANYYWRLSCAVCHAED